MRFLIINSEFPPIGGGAGNASAHTAQELIASGQDVTVLTCRFRNLPHEEIWRGVRLMRIPSLRRSESSSGAWEQLHFMISAAWASLRLARRWKPDAVIAYFGVPCGPAAWLLRKVFGIPYIVSLRGGDVPGFRPYDFALYHRLLSPIIHLVWRGAAAVVANSDGLKTLAEDFAPSLNIHIIPNGVDIEEYAPVDRAWSPAQLLFTGRLVYQKGLDVLLEALSNLDSLAWDLTIVGDGPQQNELEKQAQSLNLQDRISFVGWKHRQALNHYYQRANLFVLPSRHEGMPNALLEAMSSGLPAIASDIAGNEELVIDGKNGLLVPPDDVQALQDALHQLITQENLRREMGTAARQHIAASYSWRGTAQAYLDLLRRVV
ncbi:MAG: glycosyltransferase family 4 protein [Chloroflexota bacterium]|nr:glycosyltransferase family 4 protein [Chloroflexota bacterium]